MFLSKIKTFVNKSDSFIKLLKTKITLRIEVNKTLIIQNSKQIKTTEKQTNDNFCQNIPKILNKMKFIVGLNLIMVDWSMVKW